MLLVSAVLLLLVVAREAGFLDRFQVLPVQSTRQLLMVAFRHHIRVLCAYCLVEWFRQGVPSPLAVLLDLQPASVTSL